MQPGGGPPQRSATVRSEADTPAAFTTSIRTAAGRLFLHVHEDALRALGADAGPHSMLCTLATHMPLLHAIATRQALQSRTLSVDIRAEDLALPGGRPRSTAIAPLLSAQPRGAED